MPACASPSATFEATGVGHVAEDGTQRFRGALFYRSQSPRFSTLNGRCCVFTYDVDADGKSEGTLFTWD